MTKVIQMMSEVNDAKKWVRTIEKSALNKAFDSASSTTRQYILGALMALSAADGLAMSRAAAAPPPRQKPRPHKTAPIRLVVSNQFGRQFDGK